MSDVSKALGFGAEFTFKGKAYRLAPWKYKLQALMELRLQDEARKAVRSMRDICTDREYRELLLQVTTQIASGHYAFGGEAMQQALQALPHTQYLFYLCLKENHPEATPELVQEMFQEKLEEMMAAMGEANDDPNRPSPAVPGSA